VIPKPNNSVFVIFLFLFVMTCGSSQVAAQVFEASSPNPTVPAGSGSANFDLVFSVEQISGAFIDTCGFSFQYSHDPTVLQFSGTGAEPTGDLAAIDGGQGPGFFDGQIFTTGFTVGAVYSFTFQETIVFDVPRQLISVGYSAVPSAILNLSEELITVVNMSTNLGNPVIDNIISNCSGGTETLLGSDCVVTLMPAPPLNYEISTPDQNLLASQLVSQGLAAEFDILQVADDPADITPTNGFSFAYGHDSTYLVIDSVSQGSGLGTIKGGMGPEFFQETLFSNGAAVGCLYDFQVQETLTFDTSLHVATFNYSATPGAFDNLSDTVTTQIQQSSVLGNPAIESVVVVNGGSAIQAICLPASFTIQPTPAFTLSAPDQTASFSSTTGVGNFDVGFDLQEDPTNSTFPSATQGFSIGLGHPSSQLTVVGGGAAGGCRCNEQW